MCPSPQLVDGDLFISLFSHLLICPRLLVHYEVAVAFKTLFLLSTEWESKSGTACRAVIMIAFDAGLPICEAVDITTFGTCPHVFDTLCRHDGRVLSGRYTKGRVVFELQVCCRLKA